MSLSSPPKALLTDVFGTVVDWRSTVTNYLSGAAADSLNAASSSVPSAVRVAVASVDWGNFAWQWRMSYSRFTTSFDPSSQAFKSVDQHHLESLIDLIRKHNIEGLWDEEEIKKISMIWHFLDPWPDSSPGLGLLNPKFETCTLSNGNHSLLQDLAQYGKLPYKHLFGAEDFKAYKPHPNVYNGAVEKLNMNANECALIAAHLGDLEAAKRCGYQTIYIERSQEESWNKDQIEQAKEQGWVDMWVSVDEGGFEEVARRLGCSGDTTQSTTSRKSRAEIEADAKEGVYHETSSITSMQGHKPVTQNRKSSVEQQAEDGLYHEDPNIMK